MQRRARNLCAPLWWGVLLWQLVVPRAIAEEAHRDQLTKQALHEQWPLQVDGRIAQHQTLTHAFLVDPAKQMRLRLQGGWRFRLSESFESIFYEEDVPGLSLIVVLPNGFRIDPRLVEGNVYHPPEAALARELPAIQSWPTTGKGEPFLYELRIDEPPPGRSVRAELSFATARQGEFISLDLHDDGVDGDRTAGDGMFSVLLTPQRTGAYNFNVHATDGTTFERHQPGSLDAE